MSAYIGDVVKNGLVLYLDAASSKSYPGSGTNWVDLTGNGNDGTLTNGPTFSSENKGSIGFDGGDDLIEIPYTPSANITGLNLTLSCWIRASTVANSNAGAGLIVRGSGQNDGLYEMLLLPSGSKNYAFFRMYQVGNYWPKLTPIELNTYYHICCVYDNGTARNYINGVQEGTGSVMNSNIVGGSSAVINKLRVGNRFSDGTARFSGRMSQVQIYNRALSAAEILENYNATKGRFDTPRAINSVQPRLVTNGLVMCLDAGNVESYVSGSSTWFDLSGNGNNFIISGPDFVSSTPSHFSFLDNQTDQIYNSTPSFFNGLSIITVNVWARFDNISTDSGIISYATANSDNDYLLFYEGSLSPKRFHLWFAGGPPAYVNYTLSSAVWYNLVNVVDASKNILYINGVEISSQNRTGGTNLGTNGYCVLGQEQDSIGGGFSNVQDLLGDIAQVNVYNRALSASEVLQNYNATKGRFGL